jgi:hypothetical protein
MVKPKQTSAGAAPRKCRAKLDPASKGGKPSRDRLWRKKFLAALADTSNVSAAAALAGVQPGSAYKVRRAEPEFAREWRSALLEGYENLELEVLHRLRFGETKDGDVKFDNATALRLLGHHRETVARERAMRDNEELGTVRAAIQTKLEQLRRQVLAQRPSRERDPAADEAPEVNPHG